MTPASEPGAFNDRMMEIRQARRKSYRDYQVMFYYFHVSGLGSISNYERIYMAHRLVRNKRRLLDWSFLESGDEQVGAGRV